MPSLKDRILDVVRGGPKLSGFATITKDGKPWVRYVMAEASDDLIFRFASFTNARKVAQIEINPQVTPDLRDHRPDQHAPAVSPDPGTRGAHDGPRRPERLLERQAQGALPGPGRPALRRRDFPGLPHRVLPGRVGNRSLGEGGRRIPDPGRRPDHELVRSLQRESDALEVGPARVCLRACEGHPNSGAHETRSTLQSHVVRRAWRKGIKDMKNQRTTDTVT